MVLNDIIDQVSERPQSKATHFSSAYQVCIEGWSPKKLFKTFFWVPLHIFQGWFFNGII